MGAIASDKLPQDSRESSFAERHCPSWSATKSLQSTTFSEAMKL